MRLYNLLTGAMPLQLVAVDDSLLIFALFRPCLKLILHLLNLGSSFISRYIALGSSLLLLMISTLQHNLQELVGKLNENPDFKVQ